MSVVSMTMLQMMGLTFVIPAAVGVGYYVDKTFMCRTTKDYLTSVKEGDYFYHYIIFVLGGHSLHFDNFMIQFNNHATKLGANCKIDCVLNRKSDSKIMKNTICSATPTKTNKTIVLLINQTSMREETEFDNFIGNLPWMKTLFISIASYVYTLPLMDRGTKTIMSLYNGLDNINMNKNKRCLYMIDNPNIEKVYSLLGQWMLTTDHFKTTEFLSNLEMCPMSKDSFSFRLDE